MAYSPYGPTNFTSYTPDKKPKAPGDWLSALNARSQGLNDLYGLPKKTSVGYTPPTAPAAQEDEDPYGVNAMIAAMLAAVQKEKDAAYAQAQREAEMEYAKGQAVAQGLKHLGISDAVQKAFGNAATTQAGLAQGFSGNIREQAAAQAAEQQRLLSGTGQEGAVRNQGEAMGNVSYGMGGHMPATALNTMAAAFGADAALQPGFALQFGQMAEAARRQQWADEELPEWTKQITSVLDKKPGMLAEAKEREYERQQELAEIKREEAEAAYKRKVDARDFKAKQKKDAADRKLKQQNASWDQRVDVERLNQSGQRISQSQKSLELRAQQYAQSNSQAWARIGISDKNSQLSASRNELQWKKYKAGDKKNSGMSEAAIRQHRRNAGKIASKAWNGVSETRTIDGERVTGKVNMTYQEAMREGLAAGIPLSMMQQSLNAYWKKPGMNAPWETKGAGEGRPKVPFQLRNPKPIKNTSNVDASNPIVRDALALGPESGIKYVFGGSGSNGLDCSGFTMQMVAKHKGVQLPHQARAQYLDPRGKKVPTPALQPGDVVFFRSSRNGQGDGPPYHCGYYIGGGKYVEYYSSGKPARVSRLNSRSDYMGARRF